MAGGDANVDTWRQPVHQAALAYEGIKDVDEFLAALARDRQLAGPETTTPATAAEPQKRAVQLGWLRAILSSAVNPGRPLGYVFLGLLILAIAAVLGLSDSEPDPSSTSPAAPPALTSASESSDTPGPSTSAEGDQAEEGQSSEVPPDGSIVEAQTGAVLGDGDVVPPKVEAGSIEGGDIVRACNLTASRGCAYEIGNRPIAARAGDRIRMRLRLHNPTDDAVDFVKLHFSVFQVGRELRGDMWIDWPSGAADSASDSIYDRARLRLPDDSPVDLIYIKGTTELQASSEYGDGRTLAVLPDGIMGGGSGSVILKDLGPPPGCWDCGLESVRFVEFDAMAQ